jgi:hypothetical protein
MRVFGSGESLKLASPVTYISSEDPPFLIVHGERDDVVPVSQSEELYDRLTATGVAATLIIVENAGHGFNPAGGSISPTRAEITKATADFFDRYLKGVTTTTTRTSSLDTLPQDFSPKTPWLIIVISIIVLFGLGIVATAVLKRHRSFSREP